MLIENRREKKIMSQVGSSAQSVAQVEALINEYKGHLFEYLVGRLLAQNFGLEGKFLSSIPLQEAQVLQRQQNELSDLDPQLYSKLPELAAAACEVVLSQVSGPVKAIWVVGKLAGAGHDQSFGEADLLIDQCNQRIPLSVKLCKEGAYVNTKSAGLLSIFEKYFGHYPNASIEQQSLSLKAKESFWELGSELYEMAGLDFQGRFDEQWTAAGLGELPGQLPRAMNERVLEYYHQLIVEIYRVFTHWMEADQGALLQGLAPLLGFANPDIWQLTCYHKNMKEGRYELGDVELKRFEQVVAGEMSLGVLRPKISSFEIYFRNYVLQIRVKPMNKFTTMAVKINCSVKERKNCK